MGWALGGLALVLSLAACGGGGAESEAGAQIAETRSTIASARSAGSRSAAPAAVGLQNSDGRLLASNCSQCHGTQGTSGFGEIRGSDASELTEFATKTANRNIMAAHAQGYTPEQLQAIAAYLRQ